MFMCIFVYFNLTSSYLKIKKQRTSVLSFIITYYIALYIVVRDRDKQCCSAVVQVLVQIERMVSSPVPLLSPFCSFQ